MQLRPPVRRRRVGSSYSLLDVDCRWIKSTLQQQQPEKTQSCVCVYCSAQRMRNWRLADLFPPIATREGQESDER